MSKLLKELEKFKIEQSSIYGGAEVKTTSGTLSAAAAGARDADQDVDWENPDPIPCEH